MMMTAAPAMLPTTPPITTGMGVMPESELELFPASPVLDDVGPSATPVPAAPIPPASVEVICGDDVGEYAEDVETVDDTLEECELEDEIDVRDVLEEENEELEEVDEFEKVTVELLELETTCAFTIYHLVRGLTFSFWNLYLQVVELELTMCEAKLAGIEREDVTADGPGLERNVCDTE